MSNTNNTYFEKWSGKKAWGGNNTQDKIFLLSIDEAEKYFKDGKDDGKDRECKPTNYAKKQGVYTVSGNCYWWLRSPGRNQDSAAYVHYYGFMGGEGSNVICNNLAVRPALWINL